MSTEDPEPSPPPACLLPLLPGPRHTGPRGRADREHGRLRAPAPLGMAWELRSVPGAVTTRPPSLPALGREEADRHTCISIDSTPSHAPPDTKAHSYGPPEAASRPESPPQTPASTPSPGSTKRPPRPRRVPGVEGVAGFLQETAVCLASSSCSPSLRRAREGFLSEKLMFLSKTTRGNKQMHFKRL